MGDGVEPLAGDGVREDGGGKLATVEPAIRQQDARTEGLDDLVERGLPGFDDVAGELISIDYLGPEVAEHLGDQ